MIVSSFSPGGELSIKSILNFLNNIQIRSFHHLNPVYYDDMKKN